jgi:hypothetical protein
MSKPVMAACLKRKRIYLTRITITMLGNPSHLGFSYDETNGLLYVTAAEKDELDAFEIPPFFWRVSEHSNSCEVCRRPFFEALQFRAGWEPGSKYSYPGRQTERNGESAVVFDLTNGVRIR